VLNTMARQCGALPSLFGSVSRTYARSPVWRDSTTAEVRFQPMPKKLAIRLWHRARDFERQTRERGKQDGALGRNGLAVLYALIFDFLNYRSGALYPSRLAIAAKANISERSVGRGLANLKAAGVLDWVRRCIGEMIDGHFTLRQETNAYGICPQSCWQGYRAPPEPPAPDPGTWGATPPIDPVALAGGDRTARVAALEVDPHDKLALALARLGKALISSNGQPGQETQTSIHSRKANEDGRA
jgi:hypothetical protein